MKVLRKSAADYSNGTRALVISASYFAIAIVIGVTVFVQIANYFELEGGPADDLLWLVIWPVCIPILFIILVLPVPPELATAMFVLGGLAQAWLLWVSRRGTRLPHKS